MKLSLHKKQKQKQKIIFTKPQLISFLSHVYLSNLGVDDDMVDLLIRRYEQDVGAIVLRRVGNIEIEVILVTDPIDSRYSVTISEGHSAAHYLNVTIRALAYLC